MTKTVTVQVFKQEDTARFASALSLSQDREREAASSGNPDLYRILCVSDGLDECYINAPEYDISKPLPDAHVIVTQEIT